MALLYGELDGFKRIHDTFGHAEGEAALMEFAVSCCARSDTTSSRASGARVLRARGVVESRRRALPDGPDPTPVAERNAVSMKPYPIATSLGAVLYDEQRHQDVGAMAAEAHTLMHQDKRAASAGYGTVRRSESRRRGRCLPPQRGRPPSAAIEREAGEQALQQPQTGRVPLTA